MLRGDASDAGGILSPLVGYGDGPSPGRSMIAARLRSLDEPLGELRRSGLRGPALEERPARHRADPGADPSPYPLPQGERGVSIKRPIDSASSGSALLC